MKRTTAVLRPFFSAALLVSSLALLSGCDWFKQPECASCPSHAPAVTSADDVLLTIDGKPAITKQKFDEFYEMAVATDPQSAFAPGMSQKIYAYLEQAALMDAYLKKTHKDQDPEYRKKLEQAFELARIPVNAEFFHKEIIDLVDVADTSLESFYKEQMSKNPAFDRPPFVTKAGGVKVQAVQFNDDKSAKDFLTRVQKPDADFAALAKADKKEVQDLGVVSVQSRVDRAVLAKAKTLQPNAVEKVALTNGKYMVIKGIGPVVPAEHLSFADIIADENLKNYLKQVKQSTDLQDLMAKKFEDIKKDLNIESNTKYAEEKDSKQNAELEALIRSMRGAQEEEQKAAAKPAQAKKPAVAESAKSM